MVQSRHQRERFTVGKMTATTNEKMKGRYQMKCSSTLIQIILTWLLLTTLVINHVGVAVAQEPDAAPTNRIFLPLISAGSEDAVNAAAQGTVGVNQIIVRYRKTTGLLAGDRAAQAATLSAAVGVKLQYFREMSGNAVVFKLPARVSEAEAHAIAKRIAQQPEVAHAEADIILRHQMTPNDPRYNEQWHYFAPVANNYGANLPAAWDITTGAANIVVAVLDTGQLNHADLAGRMVAGYDFISDVTMANDGDGRDADPSDPGDWCGFSSSWHGTHVAGTIGANSNNSLGVTGVNWQSKIQHVRVLGVCGGAYSDIVDAIRWAAGLSVPGAPANATPAKVINMSLGGSGSCEASLQDAINAATAAGAVVVVSAGNSSDDAANYQPASCHGVLTVAATGRTGSRASYSNYGTTIEIGAPGGDYDGGVLSTLNTGWTAPEADTYEFYQGTSMAAPHVAGIVSLMFSVNPTLTPAQVLSILQATVTPFPMGSNCTPTLCGPGIINAAAAVAAAHGGLLPPSNLNAAAISSTQINLTWNDNSTDETSFQIQRCQGAGCTNFAQIATVGANVTSYADTGLTANTSHSYRVRASKSSGNSAYSNIASATTSDPNCTLFNSTDVPKAIADWAALESTLTVNNNIALTDVNLRNLQITHTYVGDLTAVLVSPAGTEVALFSYVGGSGQNFANTILDDEAATPITSGTAPFNGSYRPTGVLSALDGQSSAGVWRLRISDDFFGDTGSLEAWSLELCGGGASGDVIFEDGFETGNLSRWSNAARDGGDLSVSTAAALVGSQGMVTHIDDTKAIYVRDDSPNAESRYRARFHFDPNSLTMVNNAAHFILYGYRGPSTEVLRLELRKSNNVYQLRAATRTDSTSWKTGSWFNINDAANVIEFDWLAAAAAGANNGRMTLWLNGVQKGAITGVDNDTRRVDAIRLGIVAGLDTGTVGDSYFDAFKSTRQTYIGPAGAVLAAGIDAQTASEIIVDTGVEEVDEGTAADSEDAAEEDSATQRIYLPIIER
jgi:serine protease